MLNVNIDTNQRFRLYTKVCLFRVRLAKVQEGAKLQCYIDELLFINCYPTYRSHVLYYSLYLTKCMNNL